MRVARAPLRRWEDSVTVTRPIAVPAATCATTGAAWLRSVWVVTALTSVPRGGLTLGRYRVIAWLAFASLYVIIVTGSLVRLTGSGLGCVDWPACNEERFVDVSSPHAAIEQVNRLFTGVVAASVIAAMLAALLVRPRDARAVRLALLLVAGTVGQVVLGGIVVLTGLHPLSNMGHFLLSIALMAWAFWLVDATSARGLADTDRYAPAPHWKSLIGTAGWSWRAPSRARSLSRIIALMTLVAIVSGTVVTGTGPHAGDEISPRFDYSISHVARIHGASVLVTVALAVLLGVVLWRDGATRELQNAFEAFLFLAVLQGGVGYLQYFTGVPVVLVATHIALSVAVWLAALNLSLTARRCSLVSAAQGTVAH
jgi:cytochrome c oxidase assembly protein subunit 15